MWIEYLIPPLLGAFIGYVTNYIAIKMLFRPFEEKYIFGFKVPFTPGLIPRRRKEIANSIAETVEEHILPLEKLQKLFEDSNYKERLHQRVELVIDELISNILDDLRKNIKEGISLGKITIKGAVVVTAVDKLLDKAIEKLRLKLKEKLIEKVSGTIEKHIEEELPIMLSQLRIKDMVVETFMEIDIETMEKVVMGFSEKQLKHITYTGAVLGFLIGLIQTTYLLIIN
ncbi:MAG TPA: DUF445 domain-containing protein [Persephonella sp.]|uniref:YheB n=1 Tax=Persephonella marina (strain DSM 14350 / EX-H1) TaxID=123214 RepID=C0QPW5_PERMH|nr:MULTISPECIES: DUF445 family protein [Persephonella]ACO03507.1 YheB [Persephonella marina EX-H1]HCB69674.1 DUF445 domain-containing protein [Persephonella sp.]